MATRKPSRNTNTSINTKKETEEVVTESAVFDSVDPVESVEVENNTDDTNQSTQESTLVENTNTTSNVDLGALMDMIANLQNQVVGLQNQLKEAESKVNDNVVKDIDFQVPVEDKQTIQVQVKDTAQQNTERILDYLTNKKSDKEITIIHNRERLGGGSTAIRLTGLSIDFHTIGEQRVLTWQQFEELVSKYRKWFDKHIILLAPEHKDLAERYNVPYLTSSTHNVLTRNDLARIGKLSVEELTEFYQSLDKQDQSFLCSYWLGKVYENDPDFYNRYKIETLNRLSDCGAFDNTLTSMNYDYKKNPNNASIVNQGDRVNIGGNNTQQAIRIN